MAIITYKNVNNYNYLWYLQLNLSNLPASVVVKNVGFMTDVHIRWFMGAKNYNCKSADNKTIIIIPPIKNVIIITPGCGGRDDCSV